MPTLTRRRFLKSTALAAGAAFTARSWSQVAGANGDLRIAVVGLNGIGRNHVTAYRALPGVRVVAVCDVDRATFGRIDLQGADTVVDFRELLARPDLDAVSLATPNHLHALQAVWAMQAGKDVFLEKPATHNLWEGAQLLAAERKYGRIVQVGTQNRSSGALAEAIAWTQAGHLGKVVLVRGLVYKRRPSIGKVPAPVPPPATVDYDLFQGPAPLVPLRRVNFHYDWHWQWATGCGDMVAQGNHQLDVGRRFLGDPEHPPRVFTIGGRFGYEDDGETPNTFLVHYDYPVPFVFEVRGLPAKPDAYSGNAAGPSGLGAASQLAGNMDKFRGLTVGNVVECEGGYLTVSSSYASVQAFDRAHQLVQEFRGGANHYGNFVDAVRSRKAADLRASLRQGHLSSALAHLANISYRTGRKATPDEIRARFAGTVLADPFHRVLDHLAANQVDLAATPATLGRPLTFDAASERFTGECAAAAEPLRSREYRKPFVVPQLA